MNQGIQDIDAKAEAQTNEQQLICLNQTLLESVVSGDWLTYASHCSVDLTCFEAETNGVLAEGLAFHQFYFDLPAAAPGGPPAPIQVSMARPHIRWISADAAVLSYTRLTQRWSTEQRLPLAAARPVFGRESMAPGNTSMCIVPESR
ncbi:MAG: hypothetical protein ABR96_00210 [cyanobacterium BACL30 MAG-120619-bin27]|nr:MAG: hypothetical protein ABR96_00210 [cyanobacterium BACL30 MAG-120619-bin27]